MKKKARSYHHGDLKTAMIEAALQLVRKKGPRGFTLNEASRTAGVSVSAPYNHFRDKEALLVEIVLLGSRTLAMELQTAADSVASPREGLLAVYTAYVCFAKHHPDLFTVMFQSGIEKTRYPEIQAATANAFQIAVKMAAQIESSSSSAEQLALAIWSMAHGFATLSVERAITTVSIPDAEILAEALAHRLLFPSRQT